MALGAEGMQRTFAQLDRLTGRRNGEVTWDAPAQLAMRRLGFACLLYEDFDFQKFAVNGVAYLRRAFGKQWVDEEARCTNIAKQQRYAQNMLRTMAPTIHRKASIATMRKLFRNGWYCAPTMNLAVLRGQRGSINHCVLMIDMQASAVTMHDPGLPPRKAWHVPTATFRKAFTGTLKAWKPEPSRKMQ